MILIFIIDIITGIAQMILNIINTIFPQIDVFENMKQFTINIITITTQANNFIHFILGDIVVLLVPLTIALLAYKFLIYPIITVIRSIFINGNN